MAFLIFFLNFASTLFGATLPTAFYIDYSQFFDLSDGEIALLFSAYVFSLIPGLIIFGAASNKFSHKKLLLFCGGLVILAALCFGAGGDNFLLLYVGRALQGLSVAGASVSTSSIIMTLYKGKTGAFQEVLVGIAPAIGTAISPALGLILASALGDNIRVPFFVFLATYVPLLTIMFFVKVSEEKVEHRFTLQDFLPKLPKGQFSFFIRLILSTAFAWGGMGLFLSILPTWIVSLDENISTMVPMVAAMIIFLVSSLFQVLLRNRHPKTLNAVSQIMLVIGFSGMLTIFIFPNAFAVFTIATIIGVGHGASMIGALKAMKYFVAYFQDYPAGSLYSSFYVAVYLGFVLPVLLVGTLSDLFSLNAGILIYYPTVIVLNIVTFLWVLKSPYSRIMPTEAESK